MHNLKVTIIGNSVALRNRPPEKYPANKNYCQYLEEYLYTELNNTIVHVNNKALGANTVYNVITKIDDYIQTFPNFYILNLGVVDASTREIPLWFYRMASSKKDRFIYKLAEFMYRNIIIKLRPVLVGLRFKKSWISARKFKKYFETLVNTFLKETNARIIVLPINIANKRVEKALPGTTKKHEQYNQLMKDIVEKYSQEFVDLSSLTSETHYPDGVHYSSVGHKTVATKIGKIILKSLER